MADYISREAAIETVKFYEAECDPIPRAIDSLKQISAADVVEVVRCKDCKHWTGINCGYCEVWEHYISNQNYFCGSGEMGGDNG